MSTEQQKEFRSGVISEHHVVEKKNGTMAIILTVTGEDENKQQFLSEVWLNLDPASKAGLQATKDALNMFGIAKNSEFWKLDKGMAKDKFIDLTGRPVKLKANEKNGTTFWNLQVPRNLDPKKVSDFITANADALDDTDSPNPF